MSSNQVSEVTVQTQHEGLVFLADEAPFDGARFARVDLERRRVVSWHTVCPTPSYSECGSHKKMRKSYEALHGELTHSGEFPFQDGRLFDACIRTQKKTYVNSLFGGQTQNKGGRKYGADGRLL